MLTAAISDSTQELTSFHGIGSRTYERQSKGHQGQGGSSNITMRDFICVIYRQLLTLQLLTTSLVSSSWSTFEPVFVSHSALEKASMVYRRTQ